MNAARELFAQYKARGLSLIEEQLQEKAEEGENLDFKTCNSNGKNLSVKDKQEFAEAGSAFANTSGGLIVWGVDCSKNKDNIDAVNELKPFTQLNAFRAALKSCTPTLLQPGLNGIEWLLILENGETDKGYLVVFIPASQGDPIRAAAKDTHTYHMRIGDQTQIMPHSTLSDRFGRRPHPRLELRWWRSSLGTNGGRITSITLTLAICNIGLGIAKYPLARLGKVNGLDIYAHSNNYMSATQSYGVDRANLADYIWTGKPDVVIQPGIYLEITTVAVQLAEGTQSVDFELPYTLLCEGDRHEGVVRITTGQIMPDVVYKDERQTD